MRGGGPANTLPVVKLLAGLIGAVELKSVLENLDAISGGSLFRSIIERLALANEARKNGK